MTQTSACTATQGQQCTGTWLTTHETWDGDDNLLAETDARGNETDYAYDGRGNMLAVAQPAPSAGAFRPTSLYAYDAFDNLTAYCDPNATHADGLDWTGPPGTGQSSCPANARATRVAWSNTPGSGPNLVPVSYEPFGELASIVTPGIAAALNGYVRTVEYSVAQQGGMDFGLPTAVRGSAFSQSDPSTPNRTPSETYSYDANGNVVCYDAGNGPHAMAYDGMNRRTVLADPDDGSGACGNPTSGTRTASYTAYYLDGSVRYTETPAQHAASTASGVPGSAGHAFAYDQDGDELTESFPDPRGNGSASFSSYYDGADRLVEVQRGTRLRYYYDLSQGGSVSVSGSGSFRAYGNLYAQLIGQGSSWSEQGATASDALDRTVSSFRYAYRCSGCSGTLDATTTVYDDPGTGLGLPARTTDETGIVASYGYDALGRRTSVSFANDGGVTPARQFTYDANGNVLTRTSSTSGTEQFAYDGAGNVQQRAEGSALTSPATYSYAYYPDGTQSGVSIQSAALSGSIAYAYRPDGLRSSLATSWNGNSASLTWAYTAAGRTLSQGDSWGGKALAYDAFGRIASLAVPGGAFNGLQYDSEENTIGSSAYGLTTMRKYDAIGELLSDQDSPMNCPASQPEFKPNWSTYAYTNGVPTSSTSTATNCANNTFKNSTTTAQSDPHSGAVGSQYTPQTEPSPPPKFAGSCSNTPTPNKTTTFGYDAAGRQMNSTTTNTTYPWTGTCLWSKSTSTSTSASAYDGEGHEINYSTTQQGGNSYVIDAMQWGVNGHPAVVTLQGQPTLDLHWDGDDLLFATTASGALEQFNVEQSLVVQAGSTPIVTDRDMSGLRVSEHGASGTDGLCRQNAWTYGNYQTLPIKCGQAAGNLGVLVYDRIDGLDIGHGTVQGRRSYDTATSQWTVPDAYAGEIEDPASQLPYMWNRNSPYQYVDPTGYDACTFGQGWDGENCIPTLRIGSTQSRPSSASRMPNGDTVAQSIDRQNRLIGGVQTTAMGVALLPYDAEALAVAGITRATAVHHIVAQKAWRAADARAVLKKLGIGFHDVDNLVVLDKAFHQGLHTKSYYDAVNFELSTARSASDAREILHGIADKLLQGWSP